MMMYIPQQTPQDRLALVLSVGVHCLLLAVFYYWSIHQGSPQSVQAYRVELIRHNVQENTPETTNHPEKNLTNPVPAQAIEPTAVHPATHKTTQKAIPTEGITDSDHASSHTATAVPQAEAPVLDERALYTTSEIKAGASLELPGWTWDTVPHLRDQTEEVGKLVFEITIDDMGEIIAINTVEKTVTPVVEQFYKDEVAKLTFSKTSSTVAYQPTSTGKITFLLQYKNTTN